MKKLMALFSLLFVLSCAEEALHDDRTGRNLAGIEVEKSTKGKLKGDPYQVRCQKAQGVNKQGGCYCHHNQEYFNPFNGVCE